MHTVSFHQIGERLMATVNLSGTEVGIFAAPLSVEGVDDNDPEGHVPLEILRIGTRILIPYWDDPQDNDDLWINLLQNGIDQRIYTEKLSPPQPDVLEYKLTPQHLATDGKALLYYKVWKGGNGNPDPSPERKLTIDHTPLLVLGEPDFPRATLWGYLNNNTKNPPLTTGATVALPELTDVAELGDGVKIYWQGYSSLNGSGPPVANTYGVFEGILQSVDFEKRYEKLVPFDPHIRPLYNNASALVYWQLFRSKKMIGESKKGLVKIDRVTPGESQPLGLGMTSLNMREVNSMKYELQSDKVRGFSMRSGVLTVDAIVDTIADGSIPVSVLDTGKLTFKADNFLDPQDGDEIEIMYRVKNAPAWKKIPGFFDLKEAAGRIYPVELEVDSTLFPEEQTPATPTVYEIEYQIFKGGGNNADQSTIAEFAIDRTAPYEVKVPTRRKSKPTPAVTISNLPAAPGRVWNEAWMTANPNLLCSVPVNYPLRRADDTLKYELISGTTRFTAYEGTVPDTTGRFDVDTAILRTLPNLTRISHAHSWTDLPGNFSLPSDATPVFDLRLAQDPVLLPPRVPKTDPSRTTPLFLNDFSAGAVPVLAIIDQPLHGLPDDKITLRIEDPDDLTKFVTFGPVDLGTTPLNFTLTYVELAKLFEPGSTEIKEVRVTYEHERAGKTLDGPMIDIFLDFVHAGPVNPDLPDLVNPDLGAVTVTGASLTDNIIQPGDRDKPGKISVPAWFGLPNIVGGEQINFFIDGKPAGEFKPFGGETTFEADVTADFLSKLPTAVVKAYWTVSYIGQDKNIIISPEQDVDVKARQIPLQDPTIRIRRDDEISCFTMDDPRTNWRMAIGIPKDPVNLPQGKSITVHFVGVTDISGTTTVPGTDDSQPYIIKAAGVVDVAHVGTAVKFKLNQPVRGAKTFGKYWYTTDIGGTQSSKQIVKPFDMINTSFKYCDDLDAPVS